MAKILITDGMAEDGVKTLQEAGHDVDPRKLTQEELIEAIPNYDALAVRSATTVTPERTAGAPRLKVVGRAGVGVDNINLKKPLRRCRDECATWQHFISC